MQHCGLCGLAVPDEKIRRIDSGEMVCFDCLPTNNKPRLEPIPEDPPAEKILESTGVKTKWWRLHSGPGIPHKGLRSAGRFFVACGFIALIPAIWLILFAAATSESAVGLSMIFLLLTLPGAMLLSALGYGMLCLRDIAIQQRETVSAIRDLQSSLNRTEVNS